MVLSFSSVSQVAVKSSLLLISLLSNWWWCMDEYRKREKEMPPSNIPIHTRESLFRIFSHLICIIWFFLSFSSSLFFITLFFSVNSFDAHLSFSVSEFCVVLLCITSTAHDASSLSPESKERRDRQKEKSFLLKEVAVPSPLSFLFWWIFISYESTDHRMVAGGTCDSKEPFSPSSSSTMMF